MQTYTIFLDAGGVILDEEEHENARARLISQILADLIPSYSIDQYWVDAEEAVQLFIPDVYQYILWKNTKEEKAYKALTNRYKELWKQVALPLKLQKNIRKVLQELSQKYQFGILGQYGQELKTILHKEGLLTYFSYQNTQEEYRLTKPDPRYFVQVLESARVRANECIMIGDRIDKDIIPAKQVGMKTIRIKVGLHKNQTARTFEEIPDYEIRDLLELLKVLK